MCRRVSAWSCVLALLTCVSGQQNDSVTVVRESADRATLIFRGVVISFESVSPIPSNCSFAGIGGDSQSDWLIYSYCRFTNEGHFHHNSKAFEFFFTDNSTLDGKLKQFDENSENASAVDDCAAASRSKLTALRKRFFDFSKGQFYTDRFGSENDAVSVTVSPAADTPQGRRRRESSALLSTPKVLEMGVFADRALFDLFKLRYGAVDADAALREYVGVVVDTAAILGRLISPQIGLRLSHFEIWSSQPSELAVSTGGDAEYYLNVACDLVRPISSGYDFAAFLSGFDLRKDNQDIGGIAFTGHICSDLYSCTLINAGLPSGYRAGYSLAHEIGHLLGMRHDGDSAYHDSAKCDPTCCLMTPFGAGGTNARWSVCSKARYHATLLALGDDECLSNAATSEPVDSLPGQWQPDEAQCVASMGACARHYPSAMGDCHLLSCTADNGLVRTTFPFIRLDGSYCGPGKVCIAGDCLMTAAPLRRVDGGWSAWDATPEHACGGPGCSACRLVGQRRTRAQIRRCDAPYPSNGGAPCVGHTARGMLCEAHVPCSNGSASLSEYQADACRDAFGEAIPVRSRTECSFMCQSRGYFEGRLWLPNGSPCSANGLCVNGRCLHTRCTAVASAYVDSDSECPERVDCVLGHWASWSECSASCGVGNRTRHRLVDHNGANGGEPCDLTNLAETEQCENSVCQQQCEVSEWSSWFECSAPCDGGHQRRTRFASVACVSVIVEEIQACGHSPCAQLPVDCTRTWSEWSDCSSSCGSGTRNRTMVVDQLAENGGAACPSAKVTEIVGCSVAPCDACSPSTCVNGECSTEGQCECDQGWLGYNCEVSLCEFRRVSERVDHTIVNGSTLGTWRGTLQRDDCERRCVAEHCVAYVYSQPDAYCTLFSAIDGPVYMHNASAFELFERACFAGALNRTTCNYVLLSSQFVPDAADGDSMAAGYVAVPLQCQLECRVHLAADCVAFAWDSRRRLCRYYTQSPTSTEGLPGGTYEFYARTCGRNSTTT